MEIKRTLSARRSARVVPSVVARTGSHNTRSRLVALSASSHSGEPLVAEDHRDDNQPAPVACHLSARQTAGGSGDTRRKKIFNCSRLRGEADAFDGNCDRAVGSSSGARGPSTLSRDRLGSNMRKGRPKHPRSTERKHARCMSSGAERQPGGRSGYVGRRA